MPKLVITDTYTQTQVVEYTEDHYPRAEYPSVEAAANYERRLAEEDPSNVYEQFDMAMQSTDEPCHVRIVKIIED